MVHILKRLATYSRRIDTSRLLRTTSRRPKRPAAIHVAVANEYFAEKLREKDNIDIELNDIMKVSFGFIYYYSILKCLLVNNYNCDDHILINV